MFAKEELVIYGNKGVCRITDISVMDPGDESDDQLYYIMTPLNLPTSTVFVPIDNDRIVMRRLISPEKAVELIEEISEIPEITVPNEKQREQTYKNCMHACDCEKYVSLIKTLYNRKLKRLAAGKKMTATDERYMRQAEDALYSELAYQLKLTKEEVSGAVTEQLQKAGTHV